MSACVQCGQPAAPGMALLCEQCDYERRLRIDRAAWFSGIQQHMQETLRAMTAFEKQFPAGAALIEAAHRALAETFPRVDTLYRQMRRQADEADKRLQAAQEEGQRLLFEEREGE